MPETTSEIIVHPGRQAGTGVETLPATTQLPELIVKAGERARRRFVEFFTAEIRNPHTRRAYARAVRDFCRWCEGQHFQLERLNPVIVACYVEHIGRKLSAPSVKQALAAIRMLCDYLVLGPAP